MAKPADTAEPPGSDRAELKRLLRLAQGGDPVTVALATGSDGKAIILLDKRRPGRALEKELKDADPTSRNHRFGTASVSAANPKTVHFSLNKAASGLARKLVVALKGTGFNKVDVSSDDGAPPESEHDDDDIDEPAATHAHAPQHPAGPDPKKVAEQLTAIARRAAPVIQAHPEQAATLKTHLAAGQVALKAGNPAAAAAHVEALTHLLGQLAAFSSATGAGGGAAGGGGGGSGGSASPAGGTITGGKLHVRLFAERKATRAWMAKFDEFHEKKATAVEIRGQRYDREQFLNGFVYPVGAQLRHAIKIVRALDAASLGEAKAAARAAAAQIQHEVAAAEHGLDNAEGHLAAGHYGFAYGTFISSLNLAMAARATISQYDAKAIADADHMVTALEVTRDTGFTVLAIAVPEHAILIGIAGAVVKGADDWAGGEELSKVTFEFVLGVLLNRLGEKLGPALVKAWGPTVSAWLDRAAGSLIEGGLTKSPLMHKFADWIATADETALRKIGLKMMAGQKLTPDEAKPLLAAFRRFVLVGHLIDKILKHLVETLGKTIEALGKVAYEQLTAKHPTMPVKDRCLHLIEEVKKEMLKDSKAKSDLLWSTLSGVATLL